MHPIERLRYVARSGALDLAELVQDAALALGGFADDPAALVTACRSLVDRHPAAGPVWSLAARVLSAADPAAEAWRVVEEVEADGTARTLYREVPDGARVLVIGWPDTVARGLRRRGDCRLLVVDAACAFRFPVDRLLGGSLDVEEIPESGVGAAAAHADLVLFEAQGLGPSGPAEREVLGPSGPAEREVLGPSGPAEREARRVGALVAACGARAAAAVAWAAGRPVWAVAPVGRVLPAGLWRVMAQRVGDVPEPWHEPDELVPLDLVTAVVRQAGVMTPADTMAAPDCPFAPELVRPLDAPGSHR